MKKVLITGANKGIGFEVARKLGIQGNHIILGVRNLARGERALSKLKEENISCQILQIDVSDKKSIKTALDYLNDAGIDIDILINNAGIFQDDNTRLVELADEVFEETLNTNFIGAYLLSKSILPKMEHRGFGRIVNVSSGLGSIQEMSGGYGSYRISKAALNAITKVMAAEVRNPNVKINSVCPGWVRTDMGGESATRSIEHGAETIIWAANLDANGPNGGFFRDMQPATW